MTHPYATMDYAQSLSHWGRAFLVPEWNTAIQIREIAPGVFDAAGNYPFAALSPNADLAGGLAHLRREGLVAVVLVLDDFHRPTLDALKKHFTLVRPFKTHYVFNRDKGEIDYDTHHRRALKKALQSVRAEVLDWRDVGKWSALYDALIKHLNLSGLHAFPHAHHEALAKLEGFTAIGAWLGDELVSCHVWAGDGATAMSHLVASNDAGYDSRAAYVTNDLSLRHFAKAKILNFGGGAGNTDDPEDGLARFKRGFSNDTARSYICGAILDEARYAELVQQRNFHKHVEFFPAYRAP